MQVDVAKLRSAFFEDVNDHCEVLNRCIEELSEDQSSKAAFEDLLRTVHTLKSDSSAVGFEDVSDLLHQCEGTLLTLRSAESKLDGGTLHTLCQAVDQVMDLLQARRTEGDDGSCESGDVPTEHLEFDADPETLHDFVTESREHIDAAEAQLLVIENDASNQEALNAIYRSFHSLKGLASFLGLAEIQELAHHCESMLNLARESKLTLQDRAFELALASIDAFRMQVDLAENWLSTGKLKSNPDLPAFFAQLAEVNAALPGSSIDAQKKPQVEHLASAQSHEPIPQLPALDDKPAFATRSSRTVSNVRECIKVDRPRLDHLINVIGELVIGQAMLQEEVSSALGARKELPALTHLNKTVRDLQELSLSLRMVPVSSVFQKMARVVRDLARKLGKEVRFHTKGDETELDKTVVDQIGDPLLHMVRNALDHGLELPTERAKAGKPTRGEISLKAFHEGGNIYIELQDDGRGLDPEQILQKAIERNVVSPDQELSESEIIELVFAPGFSTAAEVTDVSGRGVGMDVVRKSVEALHGHVSLQSKLGVGTKIAIRLPLTLAILDGLSVRVGEEIYVLPILSVVESYSAKPSELRDIAGRGEVVLVRGDVLPLIRLNRILQSANVPPGKDSAEENLLVVIVEEGTKRYALMVDELVGQSQVVIKNLQTNYRRVEGIAAATILGDGRVSMILDLSGLVSISSSRHQEKVHTSSNTSAAVSLPFEA